MSAEILRRAASLMREDADAAVLATGDEPWWHVGVGWNEAHGTTYTVHSLAGAHVCEAGTEEQAKHIASWHPVVALAVADWLDSEADEIPPGANETKWGPIENAPAVKVARAYLGVAS